jgi:hypothetical protein
MSKHPAFLMQLQRYISEAAITASAVRNQGAKGVARAARKYLTALPLKELQHLRANDYLNWLDKKTDQLRLALPRGAQHWGTARKVINIFLRTVAYTSPLADDAGLRRLLRRLEVPLDSHVAGRLRENFEGKGLPSWKNIKTLTCDQSADYQLVAQKVAARMKIHRADLDVYYWRTSV